MNFATAPRRSVVLIQRQVISSLEQILIQRDAWITQRLSWDSQCAWKDLLNLSYALAGREVVCQVCSVSSFWVDLDYNVILNSALSLLSTAFFIWKLIYCRIVMLAHSNSGKSASSSTFSGICTMILSREWPPDQTIASAGLRPNILGHVHRQIPVEYLSSKK